MRRSQRPWLGEIGATQWRVLSTIAVYQREHARPPTVRELGRLVGISSTGHIDYHLGCLAEKGLITRERRMARAIHLTALGRALLHEDVCPMCGQAIREASA